MKRAFSLTGFQLKYLALFLMFLDHIHYFFEYTDKIPIWFSQVGRLSAPLFLFCLIEGFVHTKNRLNYFKRVYGLAVIMGLIQFGFYNVLEPLVRSDGFFPQNMMLSTFSILLVLLQGLAWIREKKKLRGWITFSVPLLLPYLLLPVFQLAYQLQAKWLLFVLNLLHFTVLPMHTSILDGGTITIILGILMYLFHKKPLVQAMVFVMVTLVFNIGLVVLSGTALSFDGLFENYYEWISVFAAVPMLLYNGEKGKGNAMFFYLFYPVHIYILYALSVLFYH